MSKSFYTIYVTNTLKYNLYESIEAFIWNTILVLNIFRRYDNALDRDVPKVSPRAVWVLGGCTTNALLYRTQKHSSGDISFIALLLYFFCTYLRLTYSYGAITIKFLNIYRVFFNFQYSDLYLLKICIWNWFYIQFI